MHLICPFWKTWSQIEYCQRWTQYVWLAAVHSDLNVAVNGAVVAYDFKALVLSQLDETRKGNFHEVYQIDGMNMKKKKPN